VIITDLLDATLKETAALGRAAGSYIMGISDPSNGGVLEVMDMAPEADAPLLDTPVLMLHGWLHNWTAWLPMIETLTAAGFQRFIRFNYETIGDELPEIGGTLDLHVTRALEQLEADSLHVIGHSLGGALARYWSQALGGSAVIDQGITLGGVINGTPYNRLPWLPEVIDTLDPDGELIEIISGGNDDRSNWTSVAAKQDLLVPPAYAHLARARQETVDGVGHVSLLYCPPVLELVSATLSAAQR